MSDRQNVLELQERKTRISGKIHKVEGIQPLTRGFKQRIMLHVPEEYSQRTGRLIFKEQYFWIEIFSTSQTDSRFLNTSAIGQHVSCSLYVNGYHWIDNRQGLQCVTKLNFIDWIKS